MTILTAAQGALYQEMRRAGLAGGRISDNPAETVVFPHIEIGETIADSMPLSGYRDGADEVALIIVWSRERGAKELKDICDQVWTLFDGKELSVPGRGSFTTDVLDVTVQRDPDGKTRKGIVRINVIHMGEKES